MAISAREKGATAAAGLLVAIALLWLLSGGDPASPRAPPEAAAAPAQQPAPSAPAPPAAELAPVPPDLAGLRLHGLLASGAILGFADGSQRLVPIGREALPGLALRRIEQGHAVFASAAGGEVRLGFDGPAQAQASPATAAAAATPGIAAAEAAQREETLHYRLGLAPRRIGGYVRGFTVRPGADLPSLARAGIRPGDTILTVGGSVLDEERMLELAWTIANSPRLDFEVERGGRRLRLALESR